MRSQNDSPNIFSYKNSVALPQSRMSNLVLLNATLAVQATRLFVCQHWYSRILVLALTSIRRQVGAKGFFVLDKRQRRSEAWKETLGIDIQYDCTMARGDFLVGRVPYQHILNGTSKLTIMAMKPFLPTFHCSMEQDVRISQTIRNV